MKRMICLCLALALLLLPGCGKQPYEEPHITTPLFHEGLMAADQGGLYGFVDKKGNWAIEPQFIFALDFIDGLAYAVVETDSGWCVGMIDHTGAWQIEPLYENIYRLGGDGFVVEQEGNIFLLDRQGNPVNGQAYKDFRPMGEGLAAAKWDGAWGFIRLDGTVAIPPQFVAVDWFSHGLANVSVIQPDGKEKWGYINTEGDFIIPPQYDLAAPFHGGVAVVGEAAEVTDSYIVAGRYGLIDQQGKALTELCYDSLDHDANGRILFKKEGLFGYLDDEGREAIPARFQKAAAFSEGLALVEEDGKQFFIDAQGQPVLTDLHTESSYFCQGRAVLQAADHYYIIDRKGRRVLDEPLDYCFGFHTDGYANFRRDGNWGVMDTQGRVLFEMPLE